MGEIKAHSDVLLPYAILHIMSCHCSMMTSWNGNIFPVTGHLCGEFTGEFPRTDEYPTQRPVTLSFDVFFDLHLNKRLSKQSWGWWFDMQSCPLWRRRNAFTSVLFVDVISSWYLWVALHYIVRRVVQKQKQTYRWICNHMGTNQITRWTKWWQNIIPASARAISLLILLLSASDTEEAVKWYKASHYDIFSPYDFVYISPT